MIMGVTMNRNVLIIGAVVAVVAIVAIAVVALDIGKDDSPDEPPWEGFRTDYVVGDYIQFEMFEDGVEGFTKYTIEEIKDDGKLVMNIVIQDAGANEIEITAEEFGIFMTESYPYTEPEITTETLDTTFGDKELQRYAQVINGELHITYKDVYGVMYYEERRSSDDTLLESKELVDTSLFDDVTDSDGGFNGEHIDVTWGDYINITETRTTGSGASIHVYSVYKQYYVNKFNSDGTLDIIDFGSDDNYTMTMDEYLGMIVYDGIIDPSTPTESMSTHFGQKDCYKIVEDGTEMYVGTDGIIYRTVSESGALVKDFDATSLF